MSTDMLIWTFCEIVHVAKTLANSPFHAFIKLLNCESDVNSFRWFGNRFQSFPQIVRRLFLPYITVTALMSIFLLNQLDPSIKNLFINFAFSEFAVNISTAAALILSIFFVGLFAWESRDT